MEVALSDPARKLYKLISDHVQIPADDLALYRDPQYSAKIDLRQNVNIMNLKLKNGMILYLKINTELKSKVPTAEMAVPIETGKDYLAEGEQMTPEMRRFQSEFGPRAVSIAFFEHRESLKPRIDSQEESSCYAFRIGEEAIKRFQAIAFQEGFATHRITFLFGRINEITGKITVHCSCEPPQVNAADHVEISPDFDITIPVAVAEQFGMKCVGMAISHKPSDEKYPMAPYMAQLAGFYQNYFGEYFTTAVVMPRGDSDVVVEAFQVSDACMKLDADKYWVEAKTPNTVAFREELWVGGMKKKEADVNFLLCAVRVRQTKSKIPCHSFPSPSQNPSKLDLKRHLSDNEFCPNWRKLFDFNLLVYLAMQSILSIKSDIPAIVSAIISKDEIAEGFMALIEGAAGLM